MPGRPVDRNDPQYTKDFANEAIRLIAEAMGHSGEASSSAHDQGRMEVAAAWSALEDQLGALLMKARSLPR